MKDRDAGVCRCSKSLRFKAEMYNCYDQFRNYLIMINNKLIVILIMNFIFEIIAINRNYFLNRK